VSGRLTAGERGMALGLAVIMVALIGVLAAGLLAFVAADLDAVAEANRGQQAFELAEAGIEVAKAHLADDPSDWSSGELHMEDAGENAVTVTVERDAENQLFIATSTGEYGGATRKIEAVFSAGDGGPELVSWRELYE
jgi:Na+-translocating ferredoxin:NAD+ oxidoreductase RnfG subunit